MGWNTDLFCNISFNKKTYNSLYDVENEIDELKNAIKNAKDAIRDAVLMTEPDKMYDKEAYSSPYEYLKDIYETNMEVLEEYMYDLFKLEYLRDNWNKCHDSSTGLAIDPPDDVQWDSAFLSGDFIRTLKYPNDESNFNA